MGFKVVLRVNVNSIYKIDKVMGVGVGPIKKAF
jgi:hypothetical protein